MRFPLLLLTALLATCLCAAWVVSLDIRPTTALAVEPQALELGELGAGNNFTLHLRNDGNVPLNISASSDGSSIAVGARAEDFESGACGNSYDAELGTTPVLLCESLNFSDASDEAGVKLAFRPRGDAAAGTYHSTILIRGSSAYGTAEQAVLLNYVIPARPAARVEAPAMLLVGSASTIVVTGKNEKPVANATVEVMGAGGRALLITNALGEAVFTPEKEGNYTYNVLGYSTGAAQTSVSGANEANGPSGLGSIFAAVPAILSFAAAAAFILFLIGIAAVAFVIFKSRTRVSQMPLVLTRSFDS